METKTTIPGLYTKELTKEKFTEILLGKTPEEVIGLMNRRPDISSVDDAGGNFIYESTMYNKYTDGYDVAIINFKDNGVVEVV
ncbi:MAG: hypothetical protein PHN88_13445 [Ignavibacteria bacterium]|nr:hypothetical protein [Ignavibacteria bacterium]